MDPNEFNKLVSETFRFLQDDYSFNIIQENDWKYLAETRDCRIIIFIEYGRFIVGIEAIGEGAKQLTSQNILPRDLDVIVVSECLNPNLNYEMITLEDGRSTDVHAEIGKRADLLKTYCEKMLKGDFSEWFQVEECMKERRKNFYKSRKK